MPPRSFQDLIRSWSCRSRSLVNLLLLDTPIKSSRPPAFGIYQEENITFKFDQKPVFSFQMPASEDTPKTTTRHCMHQPASQFRNPRLIMTSQIDTKQLAPITTLIDAKPLLTSQGTGLSMLLLRDESSWLKEVTTGNKIPTVPASSPAMLVELSKR